MNLKIVLKTINEIEKKIINQNNITDARLEQHLDNLNQIVFELIKKNKDKK